MHRYRLRLFSVVLLLIGSPLSAETEVRVSGFGTLGVVESDSNDLGFRNDFSRNDTVYQGDYSFKALSNVGLQLDFDFGSGWDAVTQWVLREQDEQTLNSVTSQAFVRYTPSPSWQFRAGRTAIDLFHLSQYRDIGIAYTWAKVPTEVYGFVPGRCIDGVDFQYRTQIDHINISTKFYLGAFESDFSSTQDAPVHFDKVRGVRIMAETFDWSLQARYSKGEMRRDNAITQFVVDAIVDSEPLFPRALAFASEVSLDKKDVVYASISGQYNSTDFTLMAEFASIDSDSRVVPKIDNGYVSLIYHWRQHHFHVTGSFADATPYFFNETVFNETVLASLIDAVERQLNSFANNQVTQSIGWRWDLTESTAFKLQLDHTRYKGRGSSLLGSELTLTQRENGETNTLFANWSFSF